MAMEIKTQKIETKEAVQNKTSFGKNINFLPSLNDCKKVNRKKALKIIYWVVSTILSFVTINANALTNALKLTLSNSAYSDETVIRYVAGATPGFDGNYDAWKLSGYNGSAPSIYTMLDSNSALSINAFGPLAKDEKITVFATVGAVGNYSLTVNQIGAFVSTVDIFIEDVNTGLFQNLRTNSVYNFTVTDTAAFNSAPQHFIVHISLPATIVVYDATCMENGQCIITKNGNNNHSYLISDAQNNIIASGTTYSETDTISNLPAGEYTLESYTGSMLGQPQIFLISVTNNITSDFSIATNPSILIRGSEINFVNESENATTYEWDFGDGTPVSTVFNASHTFTNSGLFTVTLTAFDGTCSQTISKSIEISEEAIATGILTNDINNDNLNSYYMNGMLYIETGAPKTNMQPLTINIFNISGQQVMSEKFEAGHGSYSFSFDNQSKGVYLVQVTSPSYSNSQKIYFEGNNR